MEKPEEKSEGRDGESESALEKSVGSRITAGPISNIVPPSFVQREGFAIIYGCSERTEEGKFRKYFDFWLDDKCYYTDVATKIEDYSEPSFSISELNRGLNDDGLYIAHFQCTLPPYKNDMNNFVVGCGDVYSDKDISVDEVGRFKEVSLSR